MATGSSGKGGGVRLKKRTSAARGRRATIRRGNKVTNRARAAGRLLTSSNGEVPF